METIKKKEIRSWWRDHPQTYDQNGTFKRQNIYTELPDDDLNIKLKNNDIHMIENAYYAHNRKDENFIPFEKFLPRNSNVLEIGCGLGGHSESICKLNNKLTAIDLNPTSVHVTSRRLKNNGYDASVLEMDAENLEFEDETFDFIFSWGALHHTPDTQKTMDELYRVLKPGGRVCIMLYNKNSLYNLLEVFFKIGILQGQIFKGMKHLRNIGTDGREFGGCPLAKYYSRSEIVDRFITNEKYEDINQKCFGQKQSITGYFPKFLERYFINTFSDKFFEKILSRIGLLLVTIATKK